MMLTFEGHRYMGNDGDYIRALQKAVEELRQKVKQLEAQAKKETRVKP